MKVLEGVPSRSELHSLLVNEVNYSGMSLIKETMVQVVNETLERP